MSPEPRDGFDPEELPPWEQPAAEPEPSLRYTDVGNAHRLITAHGHELRYVGAWGAWLVWDGRRLRHDTKGIVVQRAKQVAAQLFEDAIRVADSEERKKAVGWALKSEAAARIEAMIRLARTDPAVAVDPDELDADPLIINLTNGVLDLRTGQLHPHDPRRLLTKLAGTAYRPDAACPRWLTFLEQILPDPDVREFLRRWFGYCLTGSVIEHKIVFGFGVGANGKSTIQNALARVLGDYARQAAPDLLMRHREAPHPTEVADLHGARLVFAAETSQGRHLDEALVKRLTGGDRIKARFMQKDFFEFQPTHKLFVATNHRPGIEGTDHGIWRRIRLVPFEIVIPDDDQDHHLDDKLAAEAAGILAWAVEGCTAWQRDGLTEPTAVLAATADYRAEMDILGDFISDHCVLIDGISARASVLYDAYTRWAETMGERPLGQRRFGLSLRERGHTKYTNNGVWWRGIGLRAERTDHQPPDETAGHRPTDGTTEQTEGLFGK